jgi:hypothetical protein
MTSSPAAVVKVAEPLALPSGPCPELPPSTSTDEGNKSGSPRMNETGPIIKHNDKYIAVRSFGVDIGIAITNMDNEDLWHVWKLYHGRTTVINNVKHNRNMIDLKIRVTHSDNLWQTFGIDILIAAKTTDGQ